MARVGVWAVPCLGQDGKLQSVACERAALQWLWAGVWGVEAVKVGRNGG